MHCKKFIIRMDDISWDMNYGNFARVRDVLNKYGIQPLIGVIPCNVDSKLKNYSDNGISQEDFWREIQVLQDVWGWDIALHGYEHRYVNDCPGVLNRNAKSEFAGLPLEEQIEKIKKGKSILTEHGLKIKAFMAPSHSFDMNTVRAIRENGIEVVTDGNAAYPFSRNGVWFVPQLRSWPDKRGVGIDTVCYHTNAMQDKDIARLEAFVKAYYTDIISLSKLGCVGKRKKLKWIIGNTITWLPLQMRMAYSRRKR